MRGEPMRLPGLNALRAAGMVGVVLLHAGVPYSVAPMPGLAWPVGHHRTSLWIDGLFWAIESCIMPLFFTISGYCAAQGLAKLGPREFVDRRVRRILVPFVAAAVVLLPVEFYIWLLGWVVEGRLPLRKLRSLKLGPLHQDLWGFSHLWYLEYLILLSLAFAAWRAWRLHRGQAGRLGSAAMDRRFPGGGTNGRGWFRGRDESGDRSPHSRGSLLFPLTIVAAASAAVLWWSPETVAGFQHGFLPFPAKLAFSAVFFVYGTWLHGRRPSSWGWGIVWTGASLASFGLLWPAIHAQVASPLAGWARLGFGLAGGAFSAAAVTAGWMLSVGRTSLDTRMAAYLAGASFWVYLVHHPLIGLAQIAFSLTSWSAEAQFLADVVITLTISLASYEVLVRKTWLGASLEGRPRQAPPAAPAELASEACVDCRIAPAAPKAA